MQFSTNFLLFALPLLAAAAPTDITEVPANSIKKREIPGCVVRSQWGGERWDGIMKRYRTEFTTELVNPEDICHYFSCLAMTSRTCEREGDKVIVEGNYIAGAGFLSYKGCLANAKKQWAKDNGCSCEGEFCN